MRPRLLLAAAVALALAGGTAAASTALAGRSAPGADHATGPAETGQGDNGGDSGTGGTGPGDRGPAHGIPPAHSPVPGGVPSQPGAAPGRRIDVTAEVDVDVDGFLAWAALDRTTGTLIGSPNATDTSSTESMIKVWLVADHLRRASETGVEPTGQELRDAQLAIRHSNNSAAQRLYERGGQDAVVERMIDICGLADTYIPRGGSGWWSRTEMSPADAVRLGECVADGTAAGPEWTEWLLSEMRQVVGTTAEADQRPEDDFEGGRWGVIDGLPGAVRDAEVSTKNGWTRIGADSSWHLNCLAVTDGFVIAVMMRYPADYSLDYGAQRCAGVARQLFTARSP